LQHGKTKRLGDNCLVIVLKGMFVGKPSVVPPEEALESVMRQNDSRDHRQELLLWFPWEGIGEG
jgi:hypothetical protein